MSDNEASMLEQGGVPEKPGIDKKTITDGVLFIVAGKKRSCCIKYSIYLCMNKCLLGTVE